MGRGVNPLCRSILLIECLDLGAGIQRCIPRKFAKGMFSDKGIEHALKVALSLKPPNQSPYHLGLVFLDELECQINDPLAQGFIKPRYFP